MPTPSAALYVSLSASVDMSDFVYRVKQERVSFPDITIE